MTTVVIEPQQTTVNLSPQDYKHCCEHRGLNPDWIKANCFSLDKYLSKINCIFCPKIF